MTVARAARTASFPARFVLVAAMNPCPCGYSGDSRRACRCTPVQVTKYRSRLSGPLRDRIDLIVYVQPVAITDMTGDTEGESSAAVRERVLRARETQAARSTTLPIRRRGTNTQRPFVNAMLSGKTLDRVCALDEAGRRLLERSAEKLHLSARGFHRVLKVARTIADLAHAHSIAPEHLAEALQYRLVD